MTATPIPTLSLDNLTSPDALVKQVATAVPTGYFGLSVLLIVMGVTMKSLEHIPFQQRLITTLFAGLVVSAPLIGLQLLPWYYAPLLGVSLFLALILMREGD